MSETHIGENELEKNQRPDSRVRSCGQAIRTGRHARERQVRGGRRSTERTPVGAAGVQPAATEATNLPGSTLLAPGLARLKITLLPHNGHALPARISLAVPVDERADTVPDLRDLSHVQPAVESRDPSPAPSRPQPCVSRHRRLRHRQPRPRLHGQRRQCGISAT